MRLTDLVRNPFRKISGADHGAGVDAARNQFMLVARLDLKRHLPAFRMNDAHGNGDTRAERRRREVAQLNLNADGALVRFETRRQRLARGTLDDADEIGRAQHGGHPVRGKFNRVFWLDDELHLARRADFGMGFHRFALSKSFNAFGIFRQNEQNFQNSICAVSLSFKFC